MSQPKSIPPRSLRFLAVVLLTATLAACAGRPKPLDPDRTFNVTSVEVLAESTVDAGFAARLESRLEASVGRATRDVGQEAHLTVRVRDRAAGGGFPFFNTSSSAATLELDVRDAANDRTLEAAMFRATGVRSDGQSAEARLMSRLVRDVRSLLGLTGYAPHPVAGIKRAVVRPALRPDDGAEDDSVLSDAELLADPLLNGTVTPTTVNLEPEVDPAASIDLSKPLLSGAPDAEEVKKPEPVPAPAEDAAADTLPAPEAVAIPASATAPAADDEPCIITVDNDCSDPDSR
ncbi:hypothetical protein [uncultured Hoeflea sp.]|uniref:hypothetical protein n=1 Tax=uncultured Hoeflea sp. TaxID=538666 RepID=UPI00260D6FBE|nr:hypothetical protein [uncultured Hoeflea sp.]